MSTLTASPPGRRFSKLSLAVMTKLFITPAVDSDNESPTAVVTLADVAPGEIRRV
jgi:hypothetical protein